jgi:hypothetical protein
MNAAVLMFVSKATWENAPIRWHSRGILQGMRGLLPTSLAMLALSCATANGNDGSPDAFPGRGDDGGSEVDAGDIVLPDAGPSACTLALEALSFGFESGAQGFVHGPMQAAIDSGNTTWNFDHWENGGADVTCPAGSNCFGTNLTGNYIQCQRAYLVSPTIDLSACGTMGQNVTMQFQHNYDFWTGPYGGTTWFDGGLVEVSKDGTNWVAANIVFPGTIDINPQRTSSYKCVEENNFYVDGKSGYTASSGGWVNESFTIPASLASVTFQVRFVYASGVSSETTNQADSMDGTEPGWYVDDISFQ